jgi:hypothetical protein
MAAERPRQGHVTVEEREAVEARLADLYARDELELDEYEARVEQIERARTREELVAVTADLPAAEAALVPVPSAQLEPRPNRALVRASEVPSAQRVVAVFSNVTRDRDWSVPRELKVVAVFGNSELDFREARLGEGVTEVRVSVVFGNATLLVPPGVRVEANGGAVFGNFAHTHGEGAEAAGCTIRVSGRAVFGNVEIEERLPGESGRAARRRWRAERKALKRGEPAALPAPPRAGLPPAGGPER